MAQRALILGGTKGLGRALAVEALHREVSPVVVGRSAVTETVTLDPDLAGAEFRQGDLTLAGSRSGIVKPDDDFDFVFWVAGIFRRMPFDSLPLADIERMVATHLTGPLAVLEHWHRQAVAATRPYRLVVVASTSSWRLREDETLYAALKAAKAHFARNFAWELRRHLPGSQVTLVHPGGMHTEHFWAGTSQDISKFMDPAAVAKIIWGRVVSQEGLFDELQILRTDDGTPKVEFGPRLPETP